MAEELFVDVRYRGLECGSKLRIEDFAASQAYLHHPLPMPVGSPLLVDTGEGLEIPVTVSRVCEQVAGNDKPAGMFVRPQALTDLAQSWWDERVARTEEPVAIIAAPAEPAPQSAAEPSGTVAEQSQQNNQSEDEEDGDTEVVDVALPTHKAASKDPSSEIEDAADETPAKGKKKRRRKKRSTKA